MNLTNIKKNGLTLVELAVVIGLTLSVSLITFPTLTSRLRSSNLKDTVNNIISQIQQIQQYAYSGKENTAYGVKFIENEYVLFKGISSATATQNESIQLPENTLISEKTFSTGNEVYFAINSFRPNQPGLIKLSSSNEFYYISLSSEGIVRAYK